MECPKRKQNRIPEYDYSAPGAYFVTICTQERRCILSDVHTVGDGVLDVPQVYLSKYGKTVEQTLREIERQYDYLSIEKYVIMPNHVHLLIHVENDGTSRTPSPTNAVIPAFVSPLKRFTNQRCGVKLWQRSYHDHVIRNEADWQEIWDYIGTNPARWAEDRYYTE